MGRMDKIKPHAIVITHAHPDHAWGLKEGAPCPVYATKKSWELMRDYPIKQKYVIRSRTTTKIQGMTFNAFPVEHSTRCPAVGYRITAGKKSIFYAPDVVYIPHRGDALKHIDLYIGDGATLDRPLVRRSQDKLIGHTTVRTQLGWCQKEGIHRAIFTHCGSQIVKGNKRAISLKLDKWKNELALDAKIAYDGQEVSI